MFSVSNWCNKSSYATILFVQCRNKSKTHWAKLKRKNSPKYKALAHFDDFYGSVFGNGWETIREGLLRRSKYVAIVNNYGDPDETTKYLQEKGAHCLRNLMAVQQEFHNMYNPTPSAPAPSSTDDKLKQFVEKLQSQDISSIYPQTGFVPENLDLAASTNINSKQTSKQNTTPAEPEIDDSRYIDPTMGMSTECLYQYIPATQLKGVDDWVPESMHYSFYQKDKDFPLLIEPETEFSFPEHLKVYSYEMDSELSMFPEPKRCKTGVYNYYPMDCGSVLAVLALCLSPGDRVLDLCSAPGGKALVALQTLLPEIIVCNDASISRSNRTERMFADYLYDFRSGNKWRERVIISKQDGCLFTDDRGFDKVLVDVPCTTDRLSVNEDENNMFRPDRIRERLRLPELQAKLLANGLRLTRPGGSVVYSTCSLSPVQNDGVVHMALKMAFEDHGVVANIRDLSGCMAGLSSMLKLASGSGAPQYGQLVLPSVGANFGPSYVARLVRIK